MRRRNFINIGVGGLVALATASALVLPRIFRKPELESDLFVKIMDKPGIFLSIEEVLVETFTREPVYMRTFNDPELGPRVPGPVIFALEGQSMDITIVNNLNENHGFRIDGVIDSETIGPGSSGHLQFKAPEPGTYLYFDPVDDPLNRALGLHGVLVVMPASGNTPYGAGSTSQVQDLFNDLGTTEEFPGEPWLPERSFIWVLNEIDPSWNERALHGEAIDADAFREGFTPRFFTINGKSGFFCTQDKSITPRGRIGQPTLVRVVNAGLATHSLHHHGNHVYVPAINGIVQENVVLLDTYTVEPLGTGDILIPFKRPVDIPSAVWPPKHEGFPLRYPVQDACRIAQSADGGNIPQGIITDIIFDTPLAF